MRGFTGSGRLLHWGLQSQTVVLEDKLSKCLLVIWLSEMTVSVSNKSLIKVTSYLVCYIFINGQAGKWCV